MGINEEKICEYLREHPDATSVQIGNALKMWSGTLYLNLMRLERSGRITSAWANTPVPRLRLYRLAE